MKIYAALFLATLSGAVGEAFLSYGMRSFGAMDWSRPGRWLDLVLVVARNPFVLTGVVFAAGFFFIYLAALSWVDLSFAMPLTALSFVFATFMARFALGEDVSWYRWVGTLVIAAGVSLVCLDRNPSTFGPLSAGSAAPVAVTGGGPGEQPTRT